MTVAGRVAVLGIRHHGPGSARSVVAELDRVRPETVPIEGPADAADVLALAADPAMVPPVALLAYAPDAPKVSAFWPYAVFSPEWQAMAWAAAHRVPVRFCDLPAAMVLAQPRHAMADTGPRQPGEAGRRDVHGLLAGRVVRLLTDNGVLAREEAARRFAAQLSIGVPAAAQAAWAEGFLRGGGLLLVHDRDLLGVLDDWVAALSGQDFMDVLPLLRRTFSGFTAPERANVADAVKHLAGGAPDRNGLAEPVDAGRAAGALRTVAAILGGDR